VRTDGYPNKGITLVIECLAWWTAFGQHMTFVIFWLLPGLRPCVNWPAAVRACLYGGSRGTADRRLEKC